MSSLVFEVFAHLVSMVPLALLVLLYYIHMRSEDRRAGEHRYSIQDTGGCSPGDSNTQYAIPQQPCDDG